LLGVTVAPGVELSITGGMLPALSVRSSARRLAPHHVRFS
jgi:hypothetical protein